MSIESRYAARQVAAGKRTARSLLRLWRRTDPDAIALSWTRLLVEAISVLTAAQVAAVQDADAYAGRLLPEADPEGELDPAGFSGIASDGRELKGLLFTPAPTALTLIRRGTNPRQAMASGAFALEAITRTQVADAGRTATAAAIAARPDVKGYVRMLVGDTCSRCVLLAGRVYRWDEAFARHPACDCRHIPYAENVPGDKVTDPRAYFESLSVAEQDARFGKAGAQAIREGADLGQVVNARRGVQVAAGKIFTTVNARGRRRLMPEQCYREANGDRMEAIRLLRFHRYIK